MFPLTQFDPSGTLSSGGVAMTLTTERPTRLQITDRKTGDEYSAPLTKRQVCNELRWAYGGTLNDSRLFARLVVDEGIDVIEAGREGVRVNLTQLIRTYPRLRVTVLRDRRYGG